MGPNQPTERASSRTAAFTLIELMIVVGIMLLIAGTGIPPFARAMRKEGLRKAVSDVVEGCSHARAHAILQGVPTELIVRADGQISVRPMAARKTEDGIESIGLETSSTAGGAATFTGRLPDDIAVKALGVNFQDQMEQAEAHVRFFPNGTCDEFAIVLASATGEQLVTLDVITALADVKVIK